MEDYSSNNTRKRKNSSSDEEEIDLNVEKTKQNEYSPKRPKIKEEVADIKQDSAITDSKTVMQSNLLDSVTTMKKEEQTDDQHSNSNKSDNPTRRSIDSDSDDDHVNSTRYALSKLILAQMFT